MAQLVAHHESSYRDGRYAGFAAAETVRAAIARDRLTRLAPLAPAGPWLDVGASTGAFVAAARAAGIDAEGIELSAEAVAHARASGLPVREAAIDVWDPDRRFVVITLLDVVEHLLEPLPQLARIRTWLVPGGLFACTLPDCSAPTPRVLGRRWFYYAGPDHVHHFTPRTLRWLLEAAGFTDVAVRRITKPLPLGYAAEQSGMMMRGLAPIARALTRAMPARWRDRCLPLPLGEMLATARRA
jgi:SAM-dependent methyltransferase